MQLEVFFDYSSPFGYLASTQVERIARAHGARLVWKPFLLGALFKEIGTPLVPIAEMPEVKRRYTLLDMDRWAKHWGVPLSFPTRFPLRTVKPLRMTLAAEDEEGDEGSPEARADRPGGVRAEGAGGPRTVGRSARARIIHRVMRGCWAEDGDPDDDAQLRTWCEEVDVPPALVDATREDGMKEALRRATAEAVERGVPGVPTFFVGDAMFWGQDRLGFVEKALDGWRPRKG